MALGKMQNHLALNGYPSVYRWCLPLNNSTKFILLWTPINWSSGKETTIGFVDDKRQYTNDWLRNYPHTVTSSLQESAQGWKRLFYTTGGKLNLTKCAWYCISWTFTPDGLPIITENNNHIIRIQSSANKSTVTIKQLPITSPFKYLGVDNTPLVTQTKHLHTLTTSAQRGVLIFTSSKLNHYHIRMYLKTYRLPKHPTPLLTPIYLPFNTTQSKNNIRAPPSPLWTSIEHGIATYGTATVNIAVFNSSTLK